MGPPRLPNNAALVWRRRCANAQGNGRKRAVSAGAGESTRGAVRAGAYGAGSGAMRARARRRARSVSHSRTAHFDRAIRKCELARLAMPVSVAGFSHRSRRPADSGPDRGTPSLPLLGASGPFPGLARDPRSRLLAPSRTRNAHAPDPAPALASRPSPRRTLAPGPHFAPERTRRPKPATRARQPEPSKALSSQPTPRYTPPTP